MSEKIPTLQTHPSSETYHIPESAKKQIDDMSAEAQDIAAEHERLGGLSGEVASIYGGLAPNEAPNREKLYGQLHSLLEKKAKEEGRKSLAESEDLLEEYLLEFWENDQHGLSVEQKNEIIGKIIEQTRREDEARAEVEDALEINEDIEPKDENTEEDLDDAEDEVAPEEDAEDSTVPPPSTAVSHRRTVDPELLEKINQADKILSPGKRARALKHIAEQHGSIEAAERIISLSTVNPIRFIRFFTGADRSIHDRTLESISKSRGYLDERTRLEAAEQITRGNARNRAIANVVTEHSGKEVFDLDQTLAIAANLRGPSKGKYKRKIITESVHRNRDRVEDPGGLITENLRFDGLFAQVLLLVVESVNTKPEQKQNMLEKLNKALDSIPSRRRDKALAEYILLSKDTKLLARIKNPFIKNSVRKKLHPIF